MTAHGDPQQMAKARNAFLVGIGGLIIGGFAFGIPQILSETVLQPSGGQGFGVQEVGSCGDILKRELILQANANSGSRMNRVIRQREDDCLSDNWDPVVRGTDGIGASGVWDQDGARHRFIDQANALGTSYTIDGISVPSTFVRPEQGVGGNTRQAPGPDSTRDSNDNILVFFQFTKRPTDLADCWMYLSRDRLWIAN